jgi:acetylornithine deacetylase/succinyl-diaminopimelate desuccinylase-like protein
MTLEQLMDGHDVDQFYKTYVDTMKTAQNSKEKPGREKDAIEFVESLVPTDPTLAVKKVDVTGTDSRPNLIITYTPPNLNEFKKAIVLAGIHTDCVPAQDVSQLIYTYKNGQGWGRAVADNGSNVAAAVFLLKHLADKKPHFGRPIVATITVDEESSATDVGFSALVREGILNPTDYAAAVFADTPWAGWNTQGTGSFEIKVNTERAGHSGVVVGASTVAMNLYGTLNSKLLELFPSVEPYDRASLMQSNIEEGGKLEGHTATVKDYRIAGDIRTHPAHPHKKVIETLELIAASYRSNLSNHPQFGSNADHIQITFEFKAGEDGYVMDPKFLPVARRIITNSFAATGIENVEPIQSVCGGIPGLRAFSEQGILTLATGASGRPDVINGYHGPEEMIYIDDIIKGPSYLLSVVKELDKELTRLGR